METSNNNMKKFIRKDWLKSIETIAIVPQKKLNWISKTHSKGEIKERGLFGRMLRRPIKTYDEDLYSDVYFDCHNINLDYIKREYKLDEYDTKYLFEKDSLYERAHVKVLFDGGKTKYFYCSSNEEAQELLQNLLDFCKNCGNELINEKCYL